MQSMTGYGRAMRQADGREITLEIKSVNHRFLDLSFRMPRALNFAEEQIRQGLGRHAQRGHFDILVSYVNRREDARVVEVDDALLLAYRKAVAAMADLLEKQQEDLSLAQYTALPEVLRLSSQEEDRQAIALLLDETLDEALRQLVEMRLREGGHLRQDLLDKLDQLDALRSDISDSAATVVEDYRKRLQARLDELLEAPIDPQRLAQEVAILADRAAIDEELVRLGSHIAQMRLAIDGEGPVGRRLDFLVQELNREVNTIGSKAQDAQITARVIDAKGLIEKMREQVQNVE